MRPTTRPATRTAAPTRAVQVGYITRPQWAPSYAQYISAPGDKVALLPPSVSTRTAAASMIQGLTALALTQVGGSRRGKKCLPARTLVQG
jgi:NADPH:quinone reductase-like Zn-dependent oxidoreductase